MHDETKPEAVKAPADNWQHRSQNMKCGSCMWFLFKPLLEKTDYISASGNLGRCRRHAPTMAGFPAVWTTDWCGDHKIDETKF